MNQPAFTLEFSRNEVPAITAARSLAEDLAANVPITRKHLSETFTRLTGATDADNRWSLSDAHASVELAQLLYLQATSKITPGSNIAEVFDCFDRIETLTPIQYNSPKSKSASSNSRRHCASPGSRRVQPHCRVAVSLSNRRPEPACSPSGPGSAAPNLRSTKSMSCGAMHFTHYFPMYGFRCMMASSSMWFWILRSVPTRCLSTHPIRSGSSAAYRSIALARVMPKACWRPG